MKKLHSSAGRDLLVFEKGEEVISLLLKYCREENIKSAWFEAFGAGSFIEYSYYDFQVKKYVKKKLGEDFEINNITGNIAYLKNKLVTHCHISISDSKFRGSGGHVFKLIISGTLELLLTRFEAKLEREFDEETGLNLLKRN